MEIQVTITFVNGSTTTTSYSKSMMFLALDEFKAHVAEGHNVSISYK